MHVHDFGCGYGALFHHLADHPIMHRGTYLGTDMSEAMLEAARAEVRDPRARFACADGATEMADYTIVSGTFNLRSGVDQTKWSQYTEGLVRTLWAHSRRGLAFNLLHDANVQLTCDSLYYANARAWHTFARSLAPAAELLVPATREGVVAALGAILGPAPEQFQSRAQHLAFEAGPV